MALSVKAQGPYAPAANVLGTDAMYKDSSSFVAWADGIDIIRGKQDIAISTSDTTTVGTWQQALGKAKGTVISLGDSGIATVTFSGLVYNGAGPDFAVFENAFNHTFLELAFVEVSSNGIDFYRFPSHSLTDTSIAVGSFGEVFADSIHNLAGKYAVNYGTPFDLVDLDTVTGLNINSISHIRIVDVVGSLNNNYTQRDSYGRKINDIYPTPFPSGGFDLDAVGVIYMKGVGLNEQTLQHTVSVYPNPSSGVFKVNSLTSKLFTYHVTNIQGQLVASGTVTNSQLNVSNLPSGYYSLVLAHKDGLSQHKIIIR